MYATEKHVKMEAKQLLDTINELSNDLGGDIRYLHSEITALQATVLELSAQIQQLRERNES